MTRQQAFDELCAYTLQRGDAAFIHQHVVDAFAAQQADENTKPIKITEFMDTLNIVMEFAEQNSGNTTLNSTIEDNLDMLVPEQSMVSPELTGRMP